MFRGLGVIVENKIEIKTISNTNILNILGAGVAVW